MNGPALDVLTKRLDRVEREARRWRLAAVVAGGLLGIVGLMGATQTGTAPVADEIRAKRFVLVDEAGRERGQLAVIRAPETGLQQPELIVNDGREGRRGSVLNADGLTVFDETGCTRAALVGPVLYLNDDISKSIVLSPIDGLTIGGGDEIAHLGPATHGSPVLTLRGREPQLLLLDEQRQSRAVLGAITPVTIGADVAGQRPAPSLVLFDKDGKVLFKAP